MHRAPGLRRDAQAAAEDLGHQLHGQDAAGPADEVDRHDRATAHGVDVRERVGGSDPAPVKGVIHDGSEEIGRGEDRKLVRAPGRLRRRRHCRDRPAHRRPGWPVRPANGVFEFAGRNFAGAAPAVGIVGEPDGAGAMIVKFRAGHRASFTRLAYPCGGPAILRRGGVRVLVGPPVFKTGEAEHLGLAGSIPVRLRQLSATTPRTEEGHEPRRSAPPAFRAPTTCWHCPPSRPRGNGSAGASSANSSARSKSRLAAVSFHPRGGTCPAGHGRHAHCNNPAPGAERDRCRCPHQPRAGPPFPRRPSKLSSRPAAM